MVFSSTVFLLFFFPAVLLVYYNPWIKSQGFRNAVLLLASLGFYAWGEPVFVFLMLFSILVTWIIGLLLEKYRSKAKLVLFFGTAYHIMVLFIFKYVGFVAKQTGWLIFQKEIELGIELPIGISFFTFQMMSYLFDVYYKKAAVQKSVIKLALYVSLFPQLVAGPIVRYSQVEQEIMERKLTKQDFTEGMERFIYGLAKKILLSNYLAFLADSVFNSAERTIAAAWLGAICYTLQIYFDFSGYSDMAVGLGRMFGFHFSENFNYPYISKSVTEFWRRWHISLGTWFRDYVYIPLGGNRVSKGRWIANLFTVWVLTGIWHGANWTFFIWGLFYFVVLLLEKLCNVAKRMGRFAHSYTLFVVILGWVLFRSDTLSGAVIYLGTMVGIGSAGLADASFLKLLSTGVMVIGAGCLLSTPVYKICLEKLRGKNKKLEETVRSLVCLLLFSVSIVEAVASTYSPFIYFNF